MSGSLYVSLEGLQHTATVDIGSVDLSKRSLIEDALRKPHLLL